MLGARFGLLLGATLALLPGSPLAAQPAPAAQRAPADVCPSGRISRIDVDNMTVLAPTAADPGLIRWGAGVANRLHVRTRRGFIRGELLFAEGDCFDPFLASESQRLLERFGFISSARVFAEDDSVGGKRVRIETRDEWTTKLDLGVTYDEGLNLESFNFVEQNFLGRGLVAQAARRQRLEQRSSVFALSAASLLDRTNAGVRYAWTPDGGAFYEGVSRPFVGEVGRLSVSESFERSTALFSYATDAGAGVSHALLPVRQEKLTIATAARLGRVGSSIILGGSLTRESYRPQPVEVVVEGDFDRRMAPFGPLPPDLERQHAAVAATRVAMHVGMRRYRYATYEGLDAVRDVQTVGLGFFAGATVGRSLPLLTPSGAVAARDVFGRAHASWGLAAGPLLVHGGTTTEGRWEDGAWRDVLAEADLVAYARSAVLPGQTLFFRASGAGGWRTRLPYQLTLGGREGVRALGTDRFPGGRQLLFVLEDRVRLGWSPWDALDVGATLFGDLGRIWAGDVPYGVDSGWRGAAGFGLRLAFPSGSRNVWRPDIVFPVGAGASGPPVFRVTFELNRMRSGFFTPDLARSRRFNLGPEAF